MNSRTLVIKLGKCLHEERSRRKETLRQVAAVVGMQIAHLSKIERGDRLATREQAAALAQYYGLDALVVEAKRRAEEILREYGYEPATWAAVGLLEEEASHYRSDAVYVNNDAQPKQMLLLR